MVTNPERIKLASKKKLVNSLLLKINQIGTLTESIEAFKLAKRHIGGTFDNAHAGTWFKYFKRESGETENERTKRFTLT